MYMRLQMLQSSNLSYVNPRRDIRPHWVVPLSHMLRVCLTRHYIHSFNIYGASARAREPWYWTHRPSSHKPNAICATPMYIYASSHVLFLVCVCIWHMQFAEQVFNWIESELCALDFSIRLRTHMSMWHFQRWCELCVYERIKEYDS